MEYFKVAVIGGGAAGIMCALQLQNLGVLGVALLEKNDRLGKKLSATGNGQGNVTNLALSENNYFSSDLKKSFSIISAFDNTRLIEYLTSLGGLFSADSRGRVYPSSRQASSVTDLLRFALNAGETTIRLGCCVRSVERWRNGYVISTDQGKFECEYLVLACGGKAAPHFGTEGDGYRFASELGMRVTDLQPSLVQLKTETQPIRGLKGIKQECIVSLKQGDRFVVSFRGDVIFADYGVSGDAIFRISSFLKGECSLSLDFLPDFSYGQLIAVLRNKSKEFPKMRAEDLLRCIVNSGIGKAVLRRCSISFDAECCGLGKELTRIARMIKDFSLKIVGTTGFANAQVTKGGVAMDELTLSLESKKSRGVYVIGELTDVDGECGGYNLQWAFSCAVVSAQSIARKIHGSDSNV